MSKGRTRKKSGGTAITASISNTRIGCGSVVTIGEGITVNVNTSSGLSKELAASLHEFEAKLKEIAAQQPDAAADVAAVAAKAEELGKAAVGVKEPFVHDQAKKSSIREKLHAVARGLLEVLPSAATTVAALTPLAPFSALIGMSVKEVVKALALAER
jgi:hypothetical protein